MVYLSYIVTNNMTSWWCQESSGLKRDQHPLGALDIFRVPPPLEAWGTIEDDVSMRAVERERQTSAKGHLLTLRQSHAA